MVASVGLRVCLAAPVCPGQPFHSFPVHTAEICLVIGFYCRQGVIERPSHNPASGSPRLKLFMALCWEFSLGGLHLLPCCHTAGVTNPLSAWEQKNPTCLFFSPFFFSIFFPWFLVVLEAVTHRSDFFFQPRLSVPAPGISAVEMDGLGAVKRDAPCVQEGPAQLCKGAGRAHWSFTAAKRALPPVFPRC